MFVSANVVLGVARSFNSGSNLFARWRRSRGVPARGLIARKKKYSRQGSGASVTTVSHSGMAPCALFLCSRRFFFRSRLNCSRPSVVCGSDQSVRFQVVVVRWVESFLSPGRHHSESHDSFAVNRFSKAHSFGKKPTSIRTRIQFHGVAKRP